MRHTGMQKLMLSRSTNSFGHTRISQDINLRRRLSYLRADNGTNFVVRRRRSAGDVGVTVAKATGAVEVEARRPDGRTSHSGIMYRAAQASRTCWHEYMRRRELGESHLNNSNFYKTLHIFNMLLSVILKKIGNVSNLTQDRKYKPLFFL